MHICLPEAKTFHYLHSVTTFLRENVEWPHHLLLLELDKENVKRKEFYQKHLPLSFARGVILRVNLGRRSIRMVGVPSAWGLGYGYRKTFKKLDLRQFSSKEEMYDKIFVPVLTNLQGSPKQADLTATRFHKYCDVLVKPKYITSDGSNCCHYFLSDLFNYTTKKVEFSCYYYHERIFSTFSVKVVPHPCGLFSKVYRRRILE